MIKKTTYKYDFKKKTNIPKKTRDAGVNIGPRRQNVFSKQIKSRKFPCKSPTIMKDRIKHRIYMMFLFVFTDITS